MLLQTQPSQKKLGIRASVPVDGMFMWKVTWPTSCHHSNFMTYMGGYPPWNWQFAPENRPLEKEIPIGTTVLYVTFRECSYMRRVKAQGEMNSTCRFHPPNSPAFGRRRWILALKKASCNSWTKKNLLETSQRNEKSRLKHIHPLKLTVRTWKWMVGRWIFLEDGLIIFRCYVSFREGRSGTN